jgi:hypothetical protein
MAKPTVKKGAFLRECFVFSTKGNYYMLQKNMSIEFKARFFRLLDGVEILDYHPNSKGPQPKKNVKKSKNLQPRN